MNMNSSPFPVLFDNPYFYSGTAPLNEKIYGFSTDLGDIDSYYLDARPGEAYLISVSGVGADIFDPKLVIRNRAGEVVASSSGMPGSYDPVISFKPELGGGYKIDVVNEDDVSGSFPFVLSIQESSYTNPYSRPYQALTDPITGLQDLETKASFDSAIVDSVITKKELESLLYSAGDGGEVSAQEFNDLRVISGNLSSYLAPDTATYYQQIFGNVVLGSVANEYYTGGRLKADPLGDLHAGSSSEQLDKLVGKWFLGTDLPNPTFPGDAAHNNPDTIVAYAAGSGPLFEGDIDFSDVNQGHLGDCWFVAATASIAEFRPDTIRSLFIDNGDGTYGVRFWDIPTDPSLPLDNRGASEHWVTVNRQVPVYDNGRHDKIAGMTSTPSGGLTDQLWPSLLEKAAAQASELKLFSAYRGLQSGSNSFASIDAGLGEGLAMLEPSAVIYGTNRDTSSAGLRVNAVYTSFSQWQQYLAGYESAINAGNGPAIVVSMSWADASLNPIPPNADGFTFRPGHAFGIVEYDQPTSEFTIYNPWGISRPGARNVSPFKASSSELYGKFLSLPNSGDYPNGFAYSVV